MTERPRRPPTATRTAAAAAAAAFALCGAAANAAGPTVVELFTSQSCHSCPPAEGLLGELSGREDVVALEFHVDYWNDLVYGAAGRWEDPFSDAAFTDRQRRYADRIPGAQVYTPQVVIDGTAQLVGSRRAQVLRLVEKAGAAARPARVAVRPAPAGGFSVTVEPETEAEVDDRVAAAAEILLARYDRRRVTVVETGENQGRTLANYHVVRELRRLGAWRGEPVEVLLAGLRLAPGEGCAVLVQGAGQGPILGAAACPSQAPEPGGERSAARRPA